MRSIRSVLAVAALMCSLARPVCADIEPERVDDPAPAGGAKFGSAVAVDGDVLVVGSPMRQTFAVNDGAARVFRWSGSAWTSEGGQLVGAAGGDQFGSSVAVSGDTCVIGAPYRNVGPNLDQGAAFVYSRSGNSWQLVTELKASDGKANDVFGLSVGISGNTIIVGAYGADIGVNPNQGAVYVFTRSAGVWTQAAKLTNPSGAAADRLGYSVAISGEQIVAGAWGDDVGAQVDKGSASVFARVNGVWSFQDTLTGFGGAGSGFGVSVAIDHGRIAVGSPYHDHTSGADAGSVTVFEPVGSGLWEVRELLLSDGAANDRFGWSVAISGDTVVGGSQLDDTRDVETTDSVTDAGSATAFTRDPATNAWTRERRMLCPVTQQASNFGAAVAASGNVIAIGQPAANDSAVSAVGRVWVVERLGASLMSPRLPVGGQVNEDDSLGFSVDVHGDWMVCGLPTNFAQQNGNAYFFRKSPDGWQLKTALAGGSNGDQCGWDVAISNDFIVVGQVFNDAAGSNAGAVDIYRIVGDSAVFLAKRYSSEPEVDGYHGTAVDVDGIWIVAGADGDDGPGPDQTDQGSVTIYRYNGTTVGHHQLLRGSATEIYDNFGHSLELDGKYLIVGAPRAGGGNWDRGAAYIFELVNNLWVERARLTHPESPGFERFGDRVAISGDFAVVAAPHESHSGYGGAGAVYVFRRGGSPTEWVLDSRLTAPVPAQLGYFGKAVATDGRRVFVAADIIADADSPAGPGVAVFLIDGPASYYSRTLRPFSLANNAQPRAVALGGSVATVGMPQAIVPNKWRGVVATYEVDEASLGGAQTPGAIYPRLSDALMGAPPSSEVVLGASAIWEDDDIDSVGDPFGVYTLGALRTPSTSSFSGWFKPSLGGIDSAAEPMHFGGLVQFQDDSLLSADVVTFGARSRLFPAKALSINARHVRALGTTRLVDGAMTLTADDVTFAGSLTALDGTRLLASDRLTIDGTASFEAIDVTASDLLVTGMLSAAETSIFASNFTIAPNGRYVGRGSIYANTSNYRTMTFNGRSYIIGNLINAEGATITIQTDTLFFAGGSLTNNGTITGSFCCRAIGGLDVDGRFECGEEATLDMPAGALVRVTGDADIAITSHDRFRMRHGELRMDGNGVPQTLEAMSSDIGAVQIGLSPDEPGSFPIGTLSVRPGAQVTLVDGRDNDGFGLSATEAAYAEDVVIGSGAVLNNDGVIVYYRRLTNSGHVTQPSNLIPIAFCEADINDDGFLSGDDFDYFSAIFELGDESADFNGDGFVNGDDFDAYMVAFEVGC